MLRFGARLFARLAVAGMVLSCMVLAGCSTSLRSTQESAVGLTMESEFSRIELFEDSVTLKCQRCAVPLKGYESTIVTCSSGGSVGKESRDPILFGLIGGVLSFLAAILF